MLYLHHQKRHSQYNLLFTLCQVRERGKVHEATGSCSTIGQDLRSIFTSLGYGEITEDDLAVLIETADIDRDGRISLEDFRAMLRFNKGDEDEEGSFRQQSR